MSGSVKHNVIWVEQLLIRSHGQVWGQIRPQRRACSDVRPERGGSDERPLREYSRSFALASWLDLNNTALQFLREMLPG